MKISIEFNSFKLAQVFTISRGSRTQADVLTLSLQEVIVMEWVNAFRMLDTVKPWHL